MRNFSEYNVCISRKNVLVLILFLSLFSRAFTQPPSSDSLKNYLVDLEKQSWEAWKNQDSSFFFHFLSDDHIELGFYGASTKTDVVAFIASHVCKVQSYKVDKFSVTMLTPDIAVLTYWAEQNTVCHTKVPSPVWVSSIYINRNGKWENTFYQQTQAAN